MRGWPKGSRFFFAGSAGKRTFLIRLCQRMAPMRLDSRAAGRVGTKHVSFRNFMGLSAPHPELLFARAKSNQKHARREKPFRWGFSPVTPSSATTQRGLAPFGNPPASPADCPGTPVYFTCAAGVNPALRQGFRHWRKRLYAGLPAGQPSACPRVLRILPAVRNGAPDRYSRRYAFWRRVSSPYRRNPT